MSKSSNMNGTEQYIAWRNSHPIKEWINAKEVSLSAVAAMLAITPSTLNEWLRGGGRRVLEHHEVSAKMIRLCELMQTKPDALRRKIRAWREAGEKLSI